MVGRGRLVGDVLQEIWEILREITAVQQDTARRTRETDRRMQETRGCAAGASGCRWRHVAVRKMDGDADSGYGRRRVA